MLILSIFHDCLALRLVILAVLTLGLPLLHFLCDLGCCWNCLHASCDQDICVKNGSQQEDCSKLHLLSFLFLRLLAFLLG